MRRETVEEYAKRIFSPIENPQAFLRDCRECKIVYKRIEIPKKGGVRIIYAPDEELMLIQRELLQVFHQFPVANNQFGFVKGRTCSDNAKVHVYESDFDLYNNKPRVVRVGRWMLRIDLQEAFPSIRRKPLEALYRKLFRPLLKVDIFQVGDGNLEAAYEEWVRTLLQLTTIQGFMPQGFPCSPYLLNLVLVHGGIIRALQQKCEERKRDFRRYKRSPFKMSVYADDIVFSSVKDKIPNSFIGEVISIIEKRKLRVNPAKIKRSSLKYKAHKITGLVLTGKQGEFNPRVVLPKKVRNTYRGKIHLAIQILKGGREPEEEKDGFNLHQIVGYISRVRDVYRDSSIPSGLARQIKEFEKVRIEFQEHFGFDHS